MSFDFNGKRIYIAPHTPRTTMFAKEFEEQYNCNFLGFIDNFQQGEEIFKPSQITQEYDFILILSQNHGNAIYEDFSKKLSRKKLVKVEIAEGGYLYLKGKEVKKTLALERSKKRKQLWLKAIVSLLDLFHFKRTKIVFISKSSITTNNKALFIHCFKEGLDVYMLTDNLEQYKELKTLDMPVIWLKNIQAYSLMAQAKMTIQDQANLTYEINLLSPKQKSLQMWHGIPLKRLNKLTTVSYDYLISTSDFVNETTLGKVIEAKEYKDFGYPRNDIFMKETHDVYDLLFCDEAIYNFAKKNFETEKKIALYMPTHRESSKAAKIPLDFEKLNAQLQKNDTTLILKFHPFVMELYKQETQEQNYSHILFHSTQGDVYPLLKYTNILITDYSSVYFDFLLLNRPIIFFDYDKEEYEANMQGFLYAYEEFTPGIHVTRQEELHQALKEIATKQSDDFEAQREVLCDKLFASKDSLSSHKIVKALLLTQT